MKIVERLGPTIRVRLSNPNPWSGSHCGCQGCPPCSSKEGRCKKKNCLYTIECLTCVSQGRRSVYHGETHRTLFDRSQEHWDGLRRRTEDSVLSRHWEECHRDTETAPQFSIKLVKTCVSSTERQIRESLMIDEEEPSSLINNKSEWGQNPVPRQATEFRDMRWDEKTEETPERQTEMQTDSRHPRIIEVSGFSSQLSQRRKMMREEKKRETERQSDSPPVSQAASDSARGEENLQRRTGDRETTIFQQPVLRRRQPLEDREKTKRTETEKEKRKEQQRNVSQRNIRDMFRQMSWTNGLVDPDAGLRIDDNSTEMESFANNGTP